MLRKIYKFIDRKIRDNIPLFVIALLLIFTSTLCTCISYNMLDSIPATDDDYKPLLEQQETITKDFNEIYNYDNYTILPVDDYVFVTLSNDQCKVHYYFNKNLEYIDYKKEDLAMPLWECILGYITVSIGVAAFITWILLIISPFILSNFLKLLEKFDFFLHQEGGNL